MKTEFDKRFEQMSIDFDKEYANAKFQVRIFAALAALMLLATIALMIAGIYWLVNNV